MAHYTGSNQEGNKARKLAQEREDQKRKFEEVKKSIKESSGGLKTMDDIFQAKNTQMDDLFRASTVGLQSLEDFKQKQLLLHDAKRLAAEQQERAAKLVRAKKEKERKAKLAALSFSIDDEEGALLITPTPPDGSKKRKLGAADDGLSSGSAHSKQDGPSGASDNNGADQPPNIAQSKKRKKDPTADTSFLKDTEREHQELALRTELIEEYKKQQEQVKQEMIEVTYSYWDGSGHRRSIKVTKGARMDQFLEKCRRELCEAFHELRGVSTENLIYIKEDLIIPHHYTFYDLIVTKARGKSGPLFHFDVHDDVRLVQDVRVEKDESHAGKIVTRGWYERNKHIFPASRWEVYDPSTKWDKYTIK